MFGPIIVGERVRLAPPTPEMLSTFIQWFADTEVTRYLGAPFPPSLQWEKEWYERVAADKDDVMWATFATDGEPGEGRLIGTTGIHRIDWRNRHAITGNIIGEKSEWRKGYASEIVRLRTRFAFENLPLQKLSSSAFVENIGSRRALEKSGYQTVGIARRHVWRHGRWYDMWQSEVLYEDWLAAQE